MMSPIRGVLSVSALSILSLPSSILASETSPPPANVEFVPCSAAYALTKHPTLPLLYLACYRAPESKNLATIRLNTDGSILTNSLKFWENYFSANGTNNDFGYRIATRPSVLPGENLLFLAAVPDYPAKFYGETNNNEFATVALDEQGQPAKLLKAFRGSDTALGQLIAIGCDPLTRRLLVAYYVYFGWYEIGADGVPVSRHFNPIQCPINQWYWVHRQEWDRYFIMPPGPSLTVLKLARDGRATRS